MQFPADLLCHTPTEALMTNMKEITSGSAKRWQTDSVPAVLEDAAAEEKAAAADAATLAVAAAAPPAPPLGVNSKRAERMATPTRLRTNLSSNCYAINSSHDGGGSSSMALVR